MFEITFDTTKMIINNTYFTTITMFSNKKQDYWNFLFSNIF